MQLKRKIRKTAAVILSAALAGLFGTAHYYSDRLPEYLTAEAGSKLKIAEYPEISCEAYPASQQMTLSLFGAIPVKNVFVKEAEAPVLTACGAPFGIKLLMEGVMVTGLGDFRDSSGNSVCPAKEAGIREGDVICLVNGMEVNSNNRLQEIIAGSGGNSLSITVNRDGSRLCAELKPVMADSGTFCGGMWVRDSIAGIGTMTFINKETGEFAGLGHPICDSDTGELVPLQSGEAVPVEITETVKGEMGVPGELRGQFVRGEMYGILEENNGSGIFGKLDDKAIGELCSGSHDYKMAFRQDITTGEAEILTTVSGSKPESYSVEIEEIDYKSTDSSKNMVIRITDPELLAATGGIVQGMSGSPIIQNGKLVGAVTHVFVADPTRGYAVFAELMAA